MDYAGYLCLPMNLHRNLKCPGFFFLFFKWWRRVTLLHCKYISVNIYRPIGFLCLLARLLACFRIVTMGGETGLGIWSRVDQKYEDFHNIFCRMLNGQAKGNLPMSLMFLCAYTSFHRPCRVTHQQLPSSDFFLVFFMNFAWHSKKKKIRM